VTRIKLFKAICEAMWGPQYRSEAARQLGVHLRTMMRYDSGDSPIPDEIVGRLFKLLDSRTAKLDDLLEKLEDHIGEHIGWDRR
jgi:hypothetical protein